MNFGWPTDVSSASEIQRVVLHEFGQALGLEHEHQHPVGGVTWKREVVESDLMSAQQPWTRKQIESNIFSACSKA